MFRVFAFLTKREGLRMQEFIDYYEGKHIPLILSLASAPLIYKRRYLVRDQELTKSGNLVDYVMTELRFADQEAFASWMGKLLTLESLKRLRKMRDGFLIGHEPRPMSSRNLQPQVAMNVREYLGLS